MTRALAAVVITAYTQSTRNDGHLERSELQWLNKRSSNAHEHVSWASAPEPVEAKGALGLWEWKA